MRHGGPGPFLRTQAVCRAQAISSQGQALLLRGPTWASRRERERGRLNQHRLGKLRSGAPQRWPLAITDTCPPPTRPPGSSIWGSLPGLVGAVISHYRSPQLWYQVRSWLLEPREEKHPGPLSPAGRIP